MGLDCEAIASYSVCVPFFNAPAATHHLLFDTGSTLNNHTFEEGALS